MQVVRYTTLDQLTPLATDWDRLSRGVPFRSWAWTSNWWRHYGRDASRPAPDTSLYTLGVLDRAGTLLGMAPWYVERSASHGRVVRFLGSGEVCSDYLTVLCQPEQKEGVIEALAEWLDEARRPNSGRSADRDADRWDLLEWTGVDARDDVIGQLADKLQARGNTVHRRAGPNCWRIELPDSWDDFLALLSKDHRKQLRRTVRDLVATGRAVLKTVERIEDIPVAEEILIDLHQRRRRELGQPGCFASSRFRRFHRDVMPELLLGGQLRLGWVELDGKPVAAEYQLAGGGVIYAYQAGVEPDALEHSPGRLAHVTTLRRAIEEGYRGFDFLRGDEPYKAHWRARPRGNQEIRIAAARPSARLRHQVWLAGSSVKRWIRGVVGSGEW